MVKELRLNEFKVLYKAWKTGVPPLDHLLLSFFVWLAQKLLDNRVKTEVNEAIKKWETLHDSNTVSPVYEENTDKGVMGLPEMRLTAPWLKNDKNL